MNSFFTVPNTAARTTTTALLVSPTRITRKNEIIRLSQPFVGNRTTSAPNLSLSVGTIDRNNSNKKIEKQSKRHKRNNNGKTTTATTTTTTRNATLTTTMTTVNNSLTSSLSPPSPTSIRKTTKTPTKSTAMSMIRKAKLSLKKSNSTTTMNLPILLEDCSYNDDSTSFHDIQRFLEKSRSLEGEVEGERMSFYNSSSFSSSSSSSGSSKREKKIQSKRVYPFSYSDDSTCTIETTAAALTTTSTTAIPTTGMKDMPPRKPIRTSLD